MTSFTTGLLCAGVNRAGEFLVGASILSVVFFFLPLENFMAADDVLRLYEIFPMFVAEYLLLFFGFLGLSVGWYFFSLFIFTSTFLDVAFASLGGKYIYIILLLYSLHYFVFPFTLIYLRNKETSPDSIVFFASLYVCGVLTLLVYHLSFKEKVFRYFGCAAEQGRES